MGKGSRSRTINNDEFRKNWDAINWGCKTTTVKENAPAVKEGIICDHRTKKIIEEDERTESFNNGQFGVGA